MLAVGTDAEDAAAGIEAVDAWIRWDLERVKGIEPSYAAWEAAVLPLNYTRHSVAVYAVMAANAIRTGRERQRRRGSARRSPY